ncbi:ARM repeat-containing protein [Lentinus tigrinus ALCF2SS1-7]|uniref:non-specific serine/threonine protein kinase n=1 Tax=Lentinus tigrinus ALCF2SS1-6 TaxID=1328759 RepID=A0A5C2RME0_9APHY|nr:ARM repeat-containing protein [Lentinus tigrinus ALCF2SS1-6]RPD68351.1 ARM repeat-containing protein [Lentinus tigrinus ALCF2SS1-7]
MGNAQSLTRTSGALDSFVAELGGDVVYEGSLGSARFLKTVKSRHKNGYLVVKIFIKPDPGMSLRKYHRRLKMEREALADIPNVYSYQSFVETDKAGYVIRQWVASNLYDRISTRPFLSLVEKKWIAFQILNALRDARNRKVSHGDIKSENILVTSWNWVYVSDFASYKPTYLPLDDPSDFSFFFDTSGRRSCYIAPERFYTASENPDISAKKSKLASEDGEGKRDGKVTEAMDCFSAGCVIAELFLEGKPLFTLSELFKYREGELKVDTQLSVVEDEGVRQLIKQMIAIDPSTRPTFDTLLHTSRGTVFPESFYSFLHNYVSSVNEVNSPSLFSASTTPSAGPSSATLSAHKGAGAAGSSSAALNGDMPNDPLPSDSDHRMERIWADYESVEPYLINETVEETVMDVKVDYTPQLISTRPFHDVLPVELSIPNRESKLHSAWSAGKRAAAEDGPALIILSLICANIRNCYLPSSKVRALDVFLALSSHLTDEAKLDRMVPYIVDLLHDDAAIVRAAALRTLMQVLMLVTVITPSNAAIFPEYIIPAIAHLVRDPEVLVRCMYAQIIVPLADTAVRYLEMGQALKAHGSYKLSPDTQEYDEAHFEVSYDASMSDLQNSIQEHLATLLVDPSSVVKRAVLHNISSLCIFLGRQKTNDVLLSHMITYLNDRDWLLRYAFFDSIVDVAACAGGRSLEEYILPLMIQALSDVEETVVAKVLASLTSLCELGLFQKMRIWELMSATLGFLYHPNIWIRQGAAAFIASAAKHLPPSDVWCILYPSLRHLLRSDVREVDERTLLMVLKPPLDRKIFEAGVQWAMKADKTNFWRSHRSTKSESPRESMASVRQSGTPSSRVRSEEDEAQISRLQQLGMTSTEENKLQAMRDYVVKLARAISSFASRVSVEVESDALKVTTTIELQKLGVVPQTVFLRTPELEGRPSRISAHRLNSELRSPGTPRTHRTLSIDHGPTATGAPFEDLRRRLALINNSANSLAVPGSREPRSPVPHPLSVDTGLPPAHAQPELPQLERPGSPAESTVSNTNSSALRAMHRFPIGDGQKAAPAVGSSKASATGLLEAHAQILSEGSQSPSGRTSPVSVAGTVRGQERPRLPSIAPISSYDGQEPGISNLLEHLYLDNNRDLQNDFGPRVHEGPVRRRNAARHSFMPRDGSARRLEASLIAHFNSHSEAITGIAVSPDHMFFISSSDDKTVKVWDTARLERNVTSKPRHTYNQHHARVKCVCMLEGLHCFASAADDGSLHIVRVHVSQSGTLPKYSKLQVVREHRMDTPGEYITSMVHYSTDTSSNLIYATTHSAITILDLRAMRSLQRMENPRHHGPITCICLDRKRAWVICGTSTGVLSLWDIRFGILIKSWKVGLSLKGRFGRVHQVVVRPTKGKGKWIVVAVETPKSATDSPSHTLLEVWDIETTTLEESFTTRAVVNASEATEEPKEVSVDEAEANPAAAIAALVRARQESGSTDGMAKPAGYIGMETPRLETPQPPLPDVRAVVAGAEFGGHTVVHRSHMAEPDSKSSRSSGKGFLITGSEDCKLRYWDLGRPERSVVLSGIEVESDKPTYSSIRAPSGNASSYIETWATAHSASQRDRPPQRLSLINHNQQNLLKGHQDTIAALACIDSPFRGGLVSGDRAGVIKVWRVEAFDQT